MRVLPFLLLLPCLSFAPIHIDCVTVRVVACGSSRTITTVVTLGSVDLCADVRVDPHPDHRWLTVVWEVVPEPMDSLQGGAGQGNDSFDRLSGHVSNPEAPGGADTVGAVGSSKQTLNGDREALRPRPQGFKMSGLAGGSYEVIAVVYSDASQRTVHGRATARVVIR